MCSKEIIWDFPKELDTIQRESKLLKSDRNMTITFFLPPYMSIHHCRYILKNVDKFKG